MKPVLSIERTAYADLIHRIPNAGSRVRKEKRMLRFVYYFALFGLALALLVVLVALTQSAAHAQGPDQRVHFFYTKDHYQRRAQNTPETSTTNLTYNGGPVMHDTVTYTIFWAPPGHPIDAGYQSLINRFFTDVGGSNLYNIMTQYYDNAGYMQNSSALGGTWVDTTPYPHAGNLVDPLEDADILASISRAFAAKGWSPAPNRLFLVYTAEGITECFDNWSCTPGTLATEYCAYHSYYVRNTQTVLYAFIPYVESWGATNCRSFVQSPNGNMAADATISMMSHELFEAATDPEVGPEGVAWYDSDCSDNTHCGEIADKCEYRYGTLSADGSNVTLNGHPYVVQLEWSNAAFTGASYSGCVLSHGTAGPPATVESAFTASNANGKRKKTFVPGDRIYYFGEFRNDGTAACTASGFWYAKGGAKTLVNVVDTISVDPGTWYWYVKGKIPGNAPLRKYTLTVSLLCNGQISAASSKFNVVAGTSSASKEDAPEISGPFRK